MHLNPLTRRAVALAALAACSVAAHAELVTGLTTTNALVTFDSATPGNASQPVSITGLRGTNEQILGIDRRPANGQLMGLGSSGNLYALDSGNGAASFVSVLSGAALAGNSFGVDFNPVVDRLRLTSNSGQNLRVNVDTGAATVDGALNGASSSIVAAAYSNNFAGATSTTLYGIDTVQDALFIQAPPNNGTQTLVGALGVNSSGVAGFDISGQSGLAFAALSNSDTGKSFFYSINLSTGAATAVGAFGYGGNTAAAAPLLDIAVSAVPEPGTWALFGAGLAVLGLRARQQQKTR